MNGKLHLPLMVLICVVPVIAILALPALGINVGGSAWLLLILFCPLAHLVMAWQMRGHGHGETDTEGSRSRTSVLQARTGEDARKTAPAVRSAAGRRAHAFRVPKWPAGRGREIK